MSKFIGPLHKYNETREALIKSGTAKQEDYQELKKKYKHSKAKINTDKPKKKSLINRGIEKVQRIRNERARNNHFLNAEREYQETKEQYREAQELSERYENKDREVRDNAPTFEQCETLRALISKGRGRRETITGKIEATEKDIEKLLKT